MNRYQIVNISSGQVTHSYEAASPMPHQPEWGMQAYDETRYEDNGNPYVVTVPTTYSVTVTDLSADLKAERIATYSKQRSDECDAAIAAMLSPMDDVTHLMVVMYEMYQALNLSGSATEEEQLIGHANLQGYLQLMGQIQAMRNARDEDVAAYIAAQG